MSVKRVRTFCQHCHMGCPLSVTVEDGKIISIAYHSCEKGRYCTEVIYHPDRVIYPLKRVGERGEGNGKGSHGTRPWMLWQTGLGRSKKNMELRL